MNTPDIRKRNSQQHLTSLWQRSTLRTWPSPCWAFYNPGRSRKKCGVSTAEPHYNDLLSLGPEFRSGSGKVQTTKKDQDRRRNLRKRKRVSFSESRSLCGRTGSSHLDSEEDTGRGLSRALKRKGKKSDFFFLSFFFEEGVKPGVTLSLSASCWDHEDEEGEFDLQQTLILT